MVVFDGDTTSPFLDLAEASQEADVNGFGTVEDESGGRYVNGLHLVVWGVALSSSLFDCKDKRKKQ